MEDGKVDGNKLSFRVAGASYSGRLSGDWIELVRERPQGWKPRPNPLDLADPSLAIGPAPDGSDPSGMPQRRPPAEVPLVLKRVKQ